MIFDTGSFTLEFTSAYSHGSLKLSCETHTGTECTTACANQPKFDTNKSSTYVGSDDISTLTFTTGIGVYTLQYSDEYVLWIRKVSQMTH